MLAGPRCPWLWEERLLGEFLPAKASVSHSLSVVVEFVNITRAVSM